MFEIRRLAAIENGKSRAYTLQRTAVALPERACGRCPSLERIHALGIAMYAVTTFKEGPAENLVRSLLFARFGTMPHYVLTPDGELHDAGMHCISVAAVEE